MAGSITGLFAQKYKKAYKDEMPWWQKALIATAIEATAKPVFAAIGEGIGEVGKGLFLGKHGKEFMEGSRGTSVRRLLGNVDVFDTEYGLERTRLQGKHRDMPTGIYNQFYLPVFKDQYEIDHGQVTPQNKYKYDDALAVFKPEAMKLANEDAYEFNNVQTFKNLPRTEEELKRRLEEGNDWWSLSTSGRVVRKFKNWLSGKDTTKQQKEGVLSVMLGKNSAAYQRYLDNPELYKDLMSGELMKKATEARRNSSIIESDDAIRNLMKELLPVSELGERYVNQNRDIDVYRRTIDKEIGEGTYEHTAYGAFLLQQRAQDDSTVRAIVENFPSYKIMPETADRQRHMKNTYRRAFYKQLVPTQDFLNKNAERVLDVKVMGSLTEKLNQHISVFGVGGEAIIFGNRKRTNGEMAVIFSKLRLSDDPEDVLATELILNKRAELIGHAANNFADNLNSVLDELKRTDILLPLAKKMQVLNNIFPAYMDATLSSDNISVVTDPESQVTTIKIEDITKGQGVIKDFLINLKPSDAESATSKAAQILNDQQAADDATKPKADDKSMSGIYDPDDLKRAFGADKEAQDILDTNPNSEGVRNVTTLFIQKKIILDMEKRGDAELSSDDFRNINSYYKIALEEAGLKSESNAVINKTIREIVAEQLGTEVSTPLQVAEGTIGQHPYRIDSDLRLGSTLKRQLEKTQKKTKTRQAHMKEWMDLSKEERVSYGNIENFIRARN